MQNREFEKRVQQQMEELKLVPSAALWGKVEAALPAEKKPRRWLVFIVLVTVLFTGTLLLKQYFNKDNKNDGANSTVTIDTPVATAKEAAAAGTGTEETTGNKPGVIGGTQPQVNDKHTAEDILNSEAISAAPSAAKKTGSQKRITKKANSAAAISSENNTQNKKTANKQQLAKATVKIKVKAPQPVNDAAVDTGASVADAITPAAESKTAKHTTGEKNAVTVTAPSAPADSLDKKDTAAVNAVAQKPATKKNRQKARWQYGAYAAMGSAAVKNGVFSKQPVNYYAGSSAVFSQPGTGISNNYVPAAPSSGSAFAMGLAVEKNINTRFRFLTGINYLYQSNFVWVGKKVDSAVAISIDANKSITADNYYTLGYNKKYKNNYHFIEVPLLLQYRPVSKLPLYIEGGVTPSVLLQSNALVYNYTAAAYITDAAVFNRLQLLANAGAGITLFQKNKHPLSIGYQLRQGLLSVTKPAFGKQHFSNSLLYARLSFKK